VEQKVTAYKCETETKDVKVIVHEWRDVREEYKYVVCEPVITKQKVKVLEPRTKEETYKYTVMEPQHVKEKVKVCEMKPVTKEVDVVTYECVPVKTKQKRQVCETVCVPTTVEVVVRPRGCCFQACCRKADPCDHPCPQTVQYTVMKKQKVMKEVEEEVTVMQRVARTEKRKVTVYEPQMVEKEVTICKYVPVQKEGKRHVCYHETVEKEVDVHTHKLVEKTGSAWSRSVCRSRRWSSRPLSSGCPMRQRSRCRWPFAPPRLRAARVCGDAVVAESTPLPATDICQMAPSADGTGFPCPSSTQQPST